jgi:histidine kinase
LEQVFINLLINARDAIEERWGNMEYKSGDKKISLTTGYMDNKVSVKVCDTGTGIPKAILDKIFDPFFTTKKVGDGTGLGLSISYGIIKDCGGNIIAESKDEKAGACFKITFPIQDTL